ncbi:hypothetical protein [Paraburkholderia sp. ZP32-5]|uniref:hypothetical protein n=1 Tax=Paraburkholderia sp. ZP32-5 TaxID=2883245 RepID=UPI001F313DF4|nr:hypothetical protein [Paraburkholderia sp. ZP32-5]
MRLLQRPDLRFVAVHAVVRACVIEWRVASQALAFGGDIAAIGLFDFGDAIDPGLFLAKGTSIRGIPVGTRDAQEEMIRFIDKHRIKPVIDRIICRQSHCPIGDVAEPFGL